MRDHAVSAQQIVVGRNVQVSVGRPKASHSEVIMAADPKHAERLIAGVHIAYHDTTMATTSIAYDKLTVQVRSSAGAVLATLATYSNLNKNSGYAQKTFDLSAYKGRVVLLDFWATWCEGCKEEIPWFMEFQNKYKKTGLTVVGASLDDGWKSVTPYLREHKINYRIVMGTFESAKQFGVDKGMPITLLIDRHGKIADVHPGMVDKAAFEREIQTLLNENTTKTPN